MLIRQTVFGFKIEKKSEELTALSKSKSDDFGARYDKASGLSAPKPAGLVFTCIKRPGPSLRLHQLWLLNGVRSKYSIKSGRVRDLLILGSGNTIQHHGNVEFLPSNIPY
jgi:hypothetical protein